MRLTIFDYGAGNLFSLRAALAAPGVDVATETDPVQCIATDLLVLPGVGAFAHASERLAAGREAMQRAIVGGLPTVGICLGMQLLFDESEEGAGAGLGVITGRVTRLDAARLPHIGWNTIEMAPQPEAVPPTLTTAYFANSFAGRPTDTSCVRAWSTHDADRFPAVVRRYRAIGMQFHPEKSAAAGIRFLRAAVREVTA
jgi:glutamine amidotransferase